MNSNNDCPDSQQILFKTGDEMMDTVVDSTKHGIESSKYSGVFQNLDAYDVARTLFHVPPKSRKL
eukprot:9338827-Ditylum_brightwellii.AAC.1